MVISLTVERVCNTLPQLHVIVASVYSGWMSAFMIFHYPNSVLNEPTKLTQESHSASLNSSNLILLEFLKPSRYNCPLQITGR